MHSQHYWMAREVMPDRKNMILDQRCKERQISLSSEILIFYYIHLQVKENGYLKDAHWYIGVPPTTCTIR